jgi:hypothetical protein
MVAVTEVVVVEEAQPQVHQVEMVEMVVHLAEVEEVVVGVQIPVQVVSEEQVV